jgi:hypothetical protein
MDVSLDVAYDVGRSCVARARPLTRPALDLSCLDRHPRPGQAALPYRVPQAESLLGADCVEKLENRRTPKISQI